MNNNMISNPKKEVPIGISLNDKDYIMAFLTCLKEMEKNYTIVMSEASNENLYNKYLESFLEIANLQREVYELMFRYGWYQLEKEDSQKIEQKLQMIRQEYNSLQI